MSEVNELRSLIEDLVFYIENQGDYIGDLTEEGVRRSSSTFIMSRIRETVTWTPRLNLDDLVTESHSYNQ